MAISPRLRGLLLLAAGLGLFALVLWLADLEGALAALRSAGWGIALIAASQLVVIAANAQALRSALPRESRCGLAAAWRAWWIGDAVNALLPVAQIGGEAARARLLSLAGVPGPAAAAAAVATLTAGLFTLVPYGLAGALGLTLLVARPEEALAPALGMGLFALLLLAFVLVQRRGLFGRLGALGPRLSGGRLGAMAEGGKATDAALAAFYGDRRRLAACCGWRLLGWLLGSVQVWLTFAVLGIQAGALSAFVLESLGQIAKAAGFAIPGGLGVQEGGLLGVGTLLGLAGDLVLGVALTKRLRDLLLGLPGLLAFKLLEGRRTAGGRAGDARHTIER
jgi:putative membrane protein